MVSQDEAREIASGKLTQTCLVVCLFFQRHGLFTVPNSAIIPYTFVHFWKLETLAKAISFAGQLQENHFTNSPMGGSRYAARMTLYVHGHCSHTPWQALFLLGHSLRSLEPYSGSSPYLTEILQVFLDRNIRILRIPRTSVAPYGRTWVNSRSRAHNIV